MRSLSRAKIFVTVAKLESFSAAGRELGLTGAAVSKQVQNLEKQLGVQLLNRTTRQVSLTEEGAVYYDGAARALADLAETEQRLQELKERPTGKLKVNAPMSFGNAFLNTPITDFAKEYPDVTMEIDYSDSWVDVVGEGYDVVIRIGEMKDSGLKARKLGDCPIWLCASPECLEKHGKIEGIDQLKEYPAITYSQHGRSESWVYGDNTTTGSIKLRSVFSANTAELELEACLAGLGIAALPAFAVSSALRDGRLLRVLPQYETLPARYIFALFPPNRANSSRVRLFIDSLVGALESFDWTYT
ncbi:MAG: LysR substrate-binding domain-containing protein [Gammaproteobacteria bacterium]|nr:LysR substrate-binding domain-containing protein [Gammaproteobacteria bacterium]